MGWLGRGCGRGFGRDVRWVRVEDREGGFPWRHTGVCGERLIRRRTHWRKDKVVYLNNGQRSGGITASIPAGDVQGAEG